MNRYFAKITHLSAHQNLMYFFVFVISSQRLQWKGSRSHENIYMYIKKLKNLIAFVHYIWWPYVQIQFL